jgi:excisionase family DNA binding protein
LTGLSKHEVRGLQLAHIRHKGAPLCDPLTVTVAEARRLTGLGLTSLWELIAKKKLESVRVGRRRLIVFESLRRLLTPNDDQITRRSSAAQVPSQRVTAT